MKCFCSFKSKTKSTKNRKAESAPELRNQSHSDNSAVARTTKSLPSPRRISELYEEKEHSLRVFRYEELVEATQGFNRMLKIGEGGFGSVYKGKIKPAGGRGELVDVAIKKLKSDSLQGHKEWLAEVQFLGVVDHPYLVKLLGYCCEDGERGIRRLLVYEFMPNRSLEHHLFGKTVTPLSWKTRLQIIHDAAEGLAYLHEGLEQKVIYRDFKTSNILLDEAFNPKLSDFGLAREGPTGDRSHVSTAVVGTYGYAAPEYVETGHLTLQCDIWSFGVVLYEILTGRQALDRYRPTKEQKLIDWVKKFPIESHSFSIIMDPRLRNQYSLQAAKKIAKLANSCLNKNSKQRPTVSEVKEVLRQALADS